VLTLKTYTKHYGQKNWQWRAAAAAECQRWWSCHLWPVRQSNLDGTETQTDKLQQCKHERKALSLTRLANSRFNNARLRAAHSPLMGHFSSSTYDLETNTISVKYLNNFQWFFGLSDFWADTYTSQYKFFVVNGQTTTSAFYKVV